MCEGSDSNIFPSDFQYEHESIPGQDSKQIKQRALEILAFLFEQRKYKNTTRDSYGI